MSAEHPEIGLTRLIVGECGGGEGDGQSPFASAWDKDLALELFPVWTSRAAPTVAITPRRPF